MLPLIKAASIIIFIFRVRVGINKAQIKTQVAICLPLEIS